MPGASTSKTNATAVRLQKIIAEAGIASRRQAELLIEDGEVRVNGKIAEVGQKADPEQDTITVRGKVLRPTTSEFIASQRVVLLMNKPKGVLCSHNDPHHEDTIYSILPRQWRNQRLFSAGRLDKESEGLIVLTNDGDLANNLTHPANGVHKIYHVNLGHEIDENLLPKLVQGREIDGEFLHFDKVIPISRKENALKRLEIHLGHGKKREIRRLLESFGHKVVRLRRTQIGRLRIKGMPTGAIKVLNEKEENLLFQQPGQKPQKKKR
jgi:23S rRNA pseudouridine2605 synthase